MEIKLRSLTIANYDSNNLEMVKFARDMKNDQVNGAGFLYPCIDEMIEMSKCDEVMRIGYGYIMVDDNDYNKEYVGFIRPSKIHNNNTILNLDYATHPNFRKEGYGKKILMEVSEYFLENITTLKKVNLEIDKRNIASISCAKSAGFNYDHKIKNYEFVVYSKKR